MGGCWGDPGGSRSSAWMSRVYRAELTSSRQSNMGPCMCIASGSTALPRGDGARGAAQWAVARENYRRQLKRIHVRGFLRGEAVNHYYDYVNMRPRRLWRRAFDPCAIAPKARFLKSC